MLREVLKNNETLRIAIWLLPAIMLAVAVLPLPYGYYTLLRIVVSVAAGFLASNAYANKDRVGLWALVFILIMVLFNPIIPVHLDRELWYVIDFGASAVFLGYGILDKFRTELSVQKHD